MRGLTVFFRDDVGELSCMRLLSFLVVATVLGVWAYANIRAGQYVPLGMGEAGIIAASEACKAAQSHVELNCKAPADESQGEDAS